MKQIQREKKEIAKAKKWLKEHGQLVKFINMTTEQPYSNSQSIREVTELDFILEHELDSPLLEWEKRIIKRAVEIYLLSEKQEIRKDLKECKRFAKIHYDQNQQYFKGQIDILDAVLEII